MSGGKAKDGVLEQCGARMATWMNNISLVRATTTNAGDSIKITGANGSALTKSNYGWVTLPDPSTPGQLSTFSVTADVTILLTGAHWGHGTTGDITGGLLRVLAINDNGTLKWGVAKLGGRHTILTTDTSSTPTDINVPEEVLTTSAIGSATNSCREVGFFRANFDDTGGAAEDLWAIQTGVNDVITGQSADGLWQPWNPTYTGFSANPTTALSRWTQIGRSIYLILSRQNSGTSNATGFDVLAPAKANSTAVNCGILFEAIDNGSDLTSMGIVRTAVNSATLSLYTNPVLANWTNVNAKVASLNAMYEVGPAASFLN